MPRCDADIVANLLAGLVKAHTSVSSMDLSATEVLVLKDGGQAHHTIDTRTLARTFVNLNTLVIYGISNLACAAFCKLVGHVSDKWASQCMHLAPDWKWPNTQFPTWNKAIR